MTVHHIERLGVTNYGCIRHAQFALTPLHALIGPNDSGKSTALRALRTLAQFGAGAFASDSSPFDPMFGENEETVVGAAFSDRLAYEVRVTSKRVEEVVYEKDQRLASDVKPGWASPSLLAKRNESAIVRIRERLTTATMVRFDPDYLRQPASLIPENMGIAFADERGTGLASVFDAIINRDSEAFAVIQANVRTLFPSVSKVGLINVSNSQKSIAVTLANGTRVGANAMSEGLLYYLGFAALKHIDGSRLFLIEEPENGLHPARIAEVMRVLREISKESQVVIATHSPLVVNELEGGEISVVTRDAISGTKAILLSEVPGFAARASGRRLGSFERRGPVPTKSKMCSG